uniref:LRRCT domain-containing protein n=1 Tax=Cuerna arida TaxID=1464854 RepID=A0A1B6GDA1_9HEMI
MQIWVFVILLARLGSTFTPQPAPCSFNPMCLCKFRELPRNTPPKVDDINNIIQVSCVGIPFYRFPELPMIELEKLDIMSSGLDQLNEESLGGVRAEVIQLMDNSIFNVNHKSFQMTSDMVKSIDLSINQLQEIPLQALRSIKNLNHLYIQSNHIEHIKTEFSSDWGRMQESLLSLYLRNNGLRELPSDEMYSLSILRKVKWLDLDGNKLKNVEPGSLPPTLEVLSLSNNYLTRFPGKAIDLLHHLTSLSLNDNNIATIDFTFTNKKRLDQLDLSGNGLTNVDNLFNGTLTLGGIGLEHNKLMNLSFQTFKGLSLQRVNLDHNKLEFIDERAFAGVSNTLEFISLRGNNIMNVPKAFSQLKKIKHLDISSNGIKRIEEDAFSSFFDTLRYLLLSGNHLTGVPTIALKGFTKLAQLDLSYNSIESITVDDFKGWGKSIDTLFLQSNKLSYLPENAFEHTPQLQELNLSFNNIKDIHTTAFSKLADNLYKLDMSFMQTKEFPEEALKPLTSITILFLDNNAITVLPKTAFYGFGKLHYLDLEHNKLTTLPVGLFHSNVHKQLHDVWLSYNLISTIETNMFTSLSELRSVALTGNFIKVIKTYTFVQLPNLITVSLSENQISVVSEHAFIDIPRILRLDLQNNLMKEFSLSVFQNVSTSQFPMALNLSYNLISNLFVSETQSPLFIKVLDLTHNHLTEIPVNFLNAVSPSLRQLNLCHNMITHLHNTAFGNLALLTMLDISNNQIKGLHKKAFIGIEHVQYLDMSHNNIEQLHVQQFSIIGKLRIINLSFNTIRSLPRDTFLGSKLEKVDLSNNKFVVMPSGALAEIGYTLRHLDISYNYIEHLDSTMFADTPFLTVLNLSHNKLSILPDNVFSTVQSILKLDLSGNPIRANFKHIFYHTQKLRVLNLAETLLKSVPILPLPYLLELNLSSNFIAEIDPFSIKQLYQLRSLQISNNLLTSLPSQTWHFLPFLKHLDISHNLIKILTKDSFSGMGSLEHLNIENLPFLERMDSGTLSNQTMLKSLQVQTWPQIEKYRFRLASVLTTIPSLEKLSVNIQEDILSDQLLGGFSPHLKELRITGENLTAINPESLDGLEDNRGLVLSVSHTAIDSLPEQLITKLLKIKHLTLDISHNQFTTFSLDQFYKQPNTWENYGTNLISGGLILNGNQWVCDGSLLRVAQWLRRWLREQVRSTVLDVRLRAVAQIRKATCLTPDTGQLKSIFDLQPEDVSVFEKSSSPSINIAKYLVLIVCFCNYTIR